MDRSLILILCLLLICFTALILRIRRHERLLARLASPEMAEARKKKLEDAAEKERRRRADADERLKRSREMCVHDWSEWARWPLSNKGGNTRCRTCPKCGAVQYCDHSEIKLLGWDGSLYDRIEHYECLTCGYAYDMTCTS